MKAELDRHATAPRGDQDCQGNLTVELLDLGVQDERWVTGRINTQVPFREKVGADGIGPAVQRLLTVVLNNDPLILRAPNRTPGCGARSNTAMLRLVLAASTLGSVTYCCPR